MKVGTIGTMALAAVLYFAGVWITNRIKVLRQYCIPAPLVGGLIFASINTVLYATGNLYFSFDSNIQTLLMVIFFTCVGFTARIELLKQGGKAVMIALILASILTVVQNILGAGVMFAFGEDPRLGLAVGSISLVGGPGTAASFGPVLEAAGAVGGSSVGIASATFGLVMGSVLGGPIANYIIKRDGVKCSSKAVTRLEDSEVELVGSMGKRWFITACIIAFCMGCSYILAHAFTALTGVTLPWFVAAMVVSALFRNCTSLTEGEFPDLEADKLGNVCLCGFLSMTMMSLKIWELAELAAPVLAALALQSILLVVFSLWLVYRKLGRDYDAAVMTAGFIGFSMGATSNAMANMQAVTNKYGDSPASFLVIPVVGGMFIDFVNVVVISAMIPMLGLFA